MTTVTDALREAVAERQAKGESINAIAQAAGVPQPTLARFMAKDGVKRRGLTLSSADALAEYLGLELRPRRRRRKKASVQ